MFQLGVRNLCTKFSEMRENVSAKLIVRLDNCILLHNYRDDLELGDDYFFNIQGRDG